MVIRRHDRECVLRERNLFVCIDLAVMKWFGEMNQRCVMNMMECAKKGARRWRLPYRKRPLN